MDISRVNGSPGDLVPRVHARHGNADGGEWTAAGPVVRALPSVSALLAIRRGNGGFGGKVWPSRPRLAGTAGGRCTTGLHGAKDAAITSAAAEIAAQGFFDFVFRRTGVFVEQCRGGHDHP